MLVPEVTVSVLEAEEVGFVRPVVLGLVDKVPAVEAVLVDMPLLHRLLGPTLENS